MRDSYYPLRRSGSVRSRRSVLYRRLTALAGAGAILLLQGASLGKRDEVAQAESLVAERSGAVPRGETATVVPSPPLARAATVLVSCAEPQVGVSGSRDTDDGCIRTTLGESDESKPAPAVALAPGSAPTEPSTVASAPVSPQVSAATASDQELVREARAPTVTAAISEARDPISGPTVQEAASPVAPVRLASLDKALTGNWIPRTEACSRRVRSEDCLPLAMGSSGAKAGPAACRFSDITREGKRWKALARCSSEGDRWTAHVNLSLTGNRLTWSSERGTQDYSR